MKRRLILGAVLCVSAMTHAAAATAAEPAAAALSADAFDRAAEQQQSHAAPSRASSSQPAPALDPVGTATKATPRSKAPIKARGLQTAQPGSISEALNGNSSSPWAIAIGLTLLTIVPAILLAMTPLVRLLVVFHFLRQALGTQTAPSNQVLMALGLMMTWFLMQPVLHQVQDQAIAPYRAGAISGEQAIENGSEPVKQFMLRYASDKDLELFASAAMPQRMQRREDAPMQVVVPAYMISELKRGFQIGAVLFLPFLLVDLVVASVTTSIGMLQLPPVVISTPLKILLFVMVDGWHLLAGSLLKSF